MTQSSRGHQQGRSARHGGISAQEGLRSFYYPSSSAYRQRGKLGRRLSGAVTPIIRPTCLFFLFSFLFFFFLFRFLVLPPLNGAAMWEISGHLGKHLEKGGGVGTRLKRDFRRPASTCDKCTTCCRVLRVLTRQSINVLLSISRLYLPFLA